MALHQKTPTEFHKVQCLHWGWGKYMGKVDGKEKYREYPRDTQSHSAHTAGLHSQVEVSYSTDFQFPSMQISTLNM